MINSIVLTPVAIIKHRYAGLNIAEPIYLDYHMLPDVWIRMQNSNSFAREFYVIILKWPVPSAYSSEVIFDHRST